MHANSSDPKVKALVVGSILDAVTDAIGANPSLVNGILDRMTFQGHAVTRALPSPEDDTVDAAAAAGLAGGVPLLSASGCRLGGGGGVGYGNPQPLGSMPMKSEPDQPAVKPHPSPTHPIPTQPVILVAPVYVRE